MKLCNRRLLYCKKCCLCKRAFTWRVLKRQLTLTTNQCGLEWLNLANRIYFGSKPSQETFITVFSMYPKHNRSCLPDQCKYQGRKVEWGTLTLMPRQLLFWESHHPKSYEFYFLFFILLPIIQYQKVRSFTRLMLFFQFDFIEFNLLTGEGMLFLEL